jgi:predicted RNase H-like HicB family nuclease
MSDGHGAKMRMTTSVVLQLSDEGGFTATIPSLPGCISEGNTRDEALRNIREAVLLYLEPLDEDPPPAEMLVLA